MGPGAGTAILDGLALGFANVVRPGSVGVVAAAGTGAQEVTVLVDRAGAGVSRCYGTGGRDLKDEVGAITALDAIARLAADDDTDVILCVSKPPSPRSPSGCCGRSPTAGPRRSPAWSAAAWSRSRASTSPPPWRRPPSRRPAWRAAAFEPPPDPPPGPGGGGAVRGLFTGGTLCSEAAAILAERLGAVQTNAPAGAATRLEGEPTGHACLDLGEEEFTRGRPHPMIDPERARRAVRGRGGGSGGRACC